eukprot:3644041-Rhodomonas_salina.1
MQGVAARPSLSKHSRERCMSGSGRVLVGNDREEVSRGERNRVRAFTSHNGLSFAAATCPKKSGKERDGRSVKQSSLSRVGKSTEDRCG